MNEESPVFYEVICFLANGEFFRVALKKPNNLQWFTTLEQAERIAKDVMNDHERPPGVVRAVVYCASPVPGSDVVMPKKR